MVKRSKDVLDLIKSCKLSPKKWQVAKYVMDNYIDAAFLTAAELAKRAGVSEPTVIRLATALGFSGYPELQTALQDKVQARLTTINRLKRSHRYAASKNPAVQAVFTDIQNLETTLHDLDIESLNKIIGKILQADKVIILGYKMSAPLAQYLQLSLKKMIDNTVAVTATMEGIHEELVFSSERSVVVAISFPRYTRAIVDDFRLAHKRPVTTVAITDSELSPLIQYADHYLLARCKLLSYVDALAAPLSLLCAIATAVSIGKEDESLARLEEMEALWKENDFFF
jgi:DNA-binding MurR/RpiR family transcriptional regulator